MDNQEKDLQRINNLPYHTKWFRDTYIIQDLQTYMMILRVCLFSIFFEFHARFESLLA
jgi:hypothetical protein